MKEYIMSVITVSVFCSIMKIILTNNAKSTGLEFAVKIVMICVILSPLFKWSGNILTSDFSVILSGYSHNLDNEDGEEMWKKYIAMSVADEFENELETRIKDEMGITVSVDLPWHEENDSIVFEVIKVSADCNQEKCKKIETWIKLHYSLESKCVGRGD